MHFQEKKILKKEMGYRFSSGLMMSIVIILLALNYSAAKCDQGNLGTKTEKDVFLQRDTKFLLGRKMMQMDGKSAYNLGKRKPDETDNPVPEVQTLKHSDVAKREESAFLEAADEVANLMRKDYRGMARRKPPINNHEPKD